MAKKKGTPRKSTPAKSSDQRRTGSPEPGELLGTPENTNMAANATRKTPAKKTPVKIPRPSLDERLADLQANLRDLRGDEEVAANNLFAAEIDAQAPRTPTQKLPEAGALTPCGRR